MMYRYIAALPRGAAYLSSQTVAKS
jgi:hypothetical protein